jgi:asparagine synthase (glutamine-hydrolysing)
MCGIYGEIALSEADQLNPFHERFLHTLHHRGPDESGSWRSEKIFLGMCRLSIIDLAGGQQPIWNEDKSCCIVYNGELYNFLDLRPLLEKKGHVFSTQTDTEVILHAYEEWGVDCLKQLNGMFALALWDGNRERLFLARDRIGEKPLYYYRDSARLVFGSEIKVILGDETIPREINYRGLVNYLTFGYAMAPETIYKSIYKLLPGHYMVIEGGDIHISEYWDVGYEPQIDDPKLISEDYLEEKLRFLLDDSVRRRMIADVPVGAFLSGGVDSSTVVALMARHATDSVKTFSIGFNYGDAYNELPGARKTAEVLGVDHHEIFVEDIDLVGTIKKLVYHYDEPFGDAAGFPLYLLSKYARQFVKVVLSGDGGDELFGGYTRYSNEQLAARYHSVPGNQLANALVQKISPLKRYRQIMDKLSIADPVSRYAASLTIFDAGLQAHL